jgi:hypothetical protein
VDSHDTHCCDSSKTCDHLPGIHRFLHFYERWVPKIETLWTTHHCMAIGLVLELRLRPARMFALIVVNRDLVTQFPLRDRANLGWQFFETRGRGARSKFILTPRVALSMAPPRRRPRDPHSGRVGTTHFSIRGEIPRDGQAKALFVDARVCPEIHY